MRDASTLGILFLVHILFVISMLSGLALVGATVAIIHHVRTSQRKGRQQPPPAPSFEEHLRAAAEYGTPRSIRLLSHQTVQAIAAKKNPFPSSPKDGLHIVHRSSDVSSPPDNHSRSDDAQTHSFRVISGLRSASSKRF